MKMTIGLLLFTTLFCFGGWIHERVTREKAFGALEEASNALKIAGHEFPVDYPCLTESDDDVSRRDKDVIWKDRKFKKQALLTYVNQLSDFSRSGNFALNAWNAPLKAYGCVEPSCGY